MSDITMQERGFSRYTGKDDEGQGYGRNKSGGHWTYDPNLRAPWYRQTLLGIAVAQRKDRCEDLAARKHCSSARKAKLQRRAEQAQSELAGERRTVEASDDLEKWQPS